MSSPLSIRQLERLQRLLDLLRKDFKGDALRIGRKLGVSRRTVMHDLRILRSWDYEIQWSAQRHAFEIIQEGALQQVVSLSRTDFMGMLMATQAFKLFEGQEEAGDVRRAAERFAEYLPDTIRITQDALLNRLRLSNGGPNTGIGQYHPNILKALELRVKIKMAYYSASRDELVSRTVLPLAIVHHEGRWYLIGLCYLREAHRHFRLDRIRSVELTGETVPEHAFDLDAYLQQSFGMHQGKDVYTIELMFSSHQARWVREEMWHPSQTLEELPDGRLKMTMHTGGLEDVARWVMQYGAEVEVLAPQELRNHVARAHWEAASIYSNGQIHPPSLSA